MRPALSWAVEGYRQLVSVLRARHVDLAWSLAWYVSARTGLPIHELMARAWCRSLGVRHRRTCSVGRCCRPALPGATWCAECWPAERRAA